MQCNCQVQSSLLLLSAALLLLSFLPVAISQQYEDFYVQKTRTNFTGLSTEFLPVISGPNSEYSWNLKKVTESAYENLVYFMAEHAMNYDEQSRKIGNKWIQQFGWMNISDPSQISYFSLDTILNCQFSLDEPGDPSSKLYWNRAQFAIEEPSSSNNYTAYVYLFVGTDVGYCALTSVSEETTVVEFGQYTSTFKLFKLRLPDFRFVWIQDYNYASTNPSSLEKVSDDQLVLLDEITQNANTFHYPLVTFASQTGEVLFRRSIVIENGQNIQSPMLAVRYGSSFAVAGSGILRDVSILSTDYGYPSELYRMSQIASSRAIYFIQFDLVYMDIMVGNIYGRAFGNAVLHLSSLLVDESQGIYMMQGYFPSDAIDIVACYGYCGFTFFEDITATSFLFQQAASDSSTFLLLQLGNDERYLSLTYDPFEKSFIAFTRSYHFVKFYLKDATLQKIFRFDHHIIPQATPNSEYTFAHIKQLSRGTVALFLLDSGNVTIDGATTQNTMNTTQLFYFFKDFTFNQSMVDYFDFKLVFATESYCFLKWRSFPFFNFQFALEFNGTRYTISQNHFLLENLPGSLGSTSQILVSFSPFFSPYRTAPTSKAVPIFTAPQQPTNVYFSQNANGNVSLAFDSTFATYRVSIQPYAGSSYDQIGSPIIVENFTVGSELPFVFESGNRVGILIEALHVKYSLAVAAVNYLFIIPATVQQFEFLDDYWFSVLTDRNYDVSIEWSFLSNDDRVNFKHLSQNSELYIYQLEGLLLIPYIYHINISCQYQLLSQVSWQSTPLQLTDHLLTFSQLIVTPELKDSVDFFINAHQSLVLQIQKYSCFNPYVANVNLVVVDYYTSEVVFETNSTNSLSFNVTVQPLTTYSISGIVNFENTLQLQVIDYIYSTPATPPQLVSFAYDKSHINFTYIPQSIDFTDYYDTYGIIETVFDSSSYQTKDEVLLMSDTINQDSTMLQDNITRFYTVPTSDLPNCKLLKFFMASTSPSDYAIPSVSTIIPLFTPPATPQAIVMSSMKNSILLQVNSSCTTAVYQVLLTSDKYGTLIRTPVPIQLLSAMNTNDQTVVDNYLLNVTDLYSYTQYSIEVLAYQADAPQESLSNPSTAMIHSTLISDPPSQVLQLQVEQINSSSIPLLWSPPATDGGSPITHYQISVEEFGNQQFPSLLLNTSNTVTQFVVKGLKERTSYKVKVRAVNVDKQYGFYSEVVDVVTKTDPQYLQGEYFGLLTFAIIPLVLIFILVPLMITIIILLVKKKQKKQMVQLVQDPEFNYTLDQELLEQIGKQYILDFNKLNYNTNELLGSGAQGTVYKGSYFNIPVAVKLFAMSNFGLETDLSDFFNESKFLAEHSSHPNIVRFIGIAHNPQSNQIALVTELCVGGSLAKYVEKTSDMPWSLKIHILSQVASGMAYLHNSNIIHRDLKCENVLLDSNKNPRIIDFGLSKQIQDMNKTMNMTMNIGTAAYIAPELLIINNNIMRERGLSGAQGQSQITRSQSSKSLMMNVSTTVGATMSTNDSSNGDSMTSGTVKKVNYDMKVDIYAFAIMMYVVFYQVKNPYGDMLDYQILAELSRDKEFRPYLEEGEIIAENRKWFIEMMKRCWSSDPSLRPSFEEIYNEMEQHKKEE